MSEEAREEVLDEGENARRGGGPNAHLQQQPGNLSAIQYWRGKCLTWWYLVFVCLRGLLGCASHAAATTTHSPVSDGDACLQTSGRLGYLWLLWIDGWNLSRRWYFNRIIITGQGRDCCIPSCWNNHFASLYYCCGVAWCGVVYMVI